MPAASSSGEPTHGERRRNAEDEGVPRTSAVPRKVAVVGWIALVVPTGNARWRAVVVRVVLGRLLGERGRRHARRRGETEDTPESPMSVSGCMCCSCEPRCVHVSACARRRLRCVRRRNPTVPTDPPGCDGEHEANKAAPTSTIAGTGDHEVSPASRVTGAASQRNAVETSHVIVPTATATSARSTNGVTVGDDQAVRATVEEGASVFSRSPPRRGPGPRMPVESPLVPPSSRPSGWWRLVADAGGQAIP